MATFPSYACVLLEGYEESADYGVIRTEMDNSIAKQRPRRSIPIVTRSVRIKVNNRTEKAAFDIWMRDDLNGGVAWFTYTDPLTGTSKQARIVKGELKWSSPGVVWIATGELETLG